MLEREQFLSIDKTKCSILVSSTMRSNRATVLFQSANETERRASRPLSIIRAFASLRFSLRTQAHRGHTDTAVALAPLSARRVDLQDAAVLSRRRLDSFFRSRRLLWQRSNSLENCIQFIVRSLDQNQISHEATNIPNERSAVVAAAVRLLNSNKNGFAASSFLSLCSGRLPFHSRLGAVIGFLRPRRKCVYACFRSLADGFWSSGSGIF